MKPIVSLSSRGGFTLPPYLTKFNLLFALLLASACTQDDGGGFQPLPPGQYPMEFTAAGIALSVETRATTDNDWQGVASVAVQVGDEV